MAKKSIKLGLVFFLCSFIFLPSTSFAFNPTDRVQKVEFGFDISGAIASDSELSSAMYLGGNASYGMNEQFAIGVSLGRMEFSQNETTVGATTIPGPSIAGHPLFVDFIFRKNIPGKSYVPYGVLGLGTIFWSTKDVFGSNNLQYEAIVDTSIACKLGAGVDWFLDDHWALNLNLDYVFTNSSSVLSNGDISVQEDINLDYWNIGAGIKYLY